MGEIAQIAQNQKESIETLLSICDTDQLAGVLGLGRKQLFLLTKNCSRHYRPITLKKKNGKDRRIHAPDEMLKAVQRKILCRILANLPASSYATAYVKQRSLPENASPHVGKRYLLKLDITDFFGSIRFAEVYSAAFSTKYFPKQIGAMLTTLCCRDDVLPQGAPTSPALSNLVLRNFDNNMGQWCSRHGISYTRYCDDMTFSSDRPLYPVYEKAKAMLEEMGFALNEKKTRFVTSAARQSVTGLTVNEKVAVPGEYKRTLRQEVYYALRFGIVDCAKKIGAQPESFYNHLMGKLRFVLQIEPENRWFRNALAELREKDLQRNV